jgi:predicted ribosomally synthesized peptide with SipW-like signal peptide
MTDKFELSRRKALLGLGTIGLAGAGAGVGTSALFSDEESFSNNQMVAGELDLFVDYYTDAENTESLGEGGTTGLGTNDGGVSGAYVLNDVKPGDSGHLIFCPKIVDNEAYLWAGSSGFTQYENGLTEPEADVDPTAPTDAGSLGSQSGAGEGELADNINVTVSYCSVSLPSDADTLADLESGELSWEDDVTIDRELRNPSDYTLADLLLELQTGFRISDEADGTFPASDSNTDQNGPCLCIEWNVPSTVGNIIQSDGVTFDFGFNAVQSRNVDNPEQENPYADTVATADYFNPAGHGTPTNGTLVSTVSFGDGIVALSFRADDDDDGIDLFDTADYPSTNLPVMIDADQNGNTDYQVAWQEDVFDDSAEKGDFDSAPFAKREHDNSDGSPGAYVALPDDFSAVKAGNTITFGIPQSELGSSFDFSAWVSTGGEGPVVELSTDSDNTPNFTSSTNYIEASDS